MPDIGPKRVRWWPLAIGAVVIAGAAAAGVFLHPVWQEFQARKAISQSLDTLEPVQAQLNDFIDRTGFLPNSNLDAGLQEAESYANGPVASLRIGRSALITVTYGEDVPLVGGETILFVPEQKDQGQGLRWRCDSGSVDPRWLPEACQYRTVVAKQSSSSSSLISDLGDLKQAAESLPVMKRDPLADRASSAKRLIAEQISDTASIRRQSLQYYMANVAWPDDNNDIGLPPANRAGGPYLRHLKLLPDGSIEMRFNDRVASLDGHRFWIRPTMPGQWRCDSTLPDDHLPAACDTALR